MNEVGIGASKGDSTSFLSRLARPLATSREPSKLNPPTKQAIARDRHRRGASGRRDLAPCVAVVFAFTRWHLIDRHVRLSDRFRILYRSDISRVLRAHATFRELARVIRAAAYRVSIFIARGISHRWGLLDQPGFPAPPIGSKQPFYPWTRARPARRESSLHHVTVVETRECHVQNNTVYANDARVTREWLCHDHGNDRDVVTVDFNDPPVDSGEQLNYAEGG